MDIKNILLYTNPEFDRRLKSGISKLYQVFFIENNINIRIINKKFLKTHQPEENEILVIAGGDGTVHQAINAIPKEYLGKYIFGIIPAGTANEFAKSLSIPVSIEHSARIISRPQNITKHQLGLVNGKHLFLTGLLYGMENYAIKLTPKFVKYYLKEVSYLIGATKTILRLLKNQYKYQKSFTINNEHHKTSYLLINNASLISKNVQKDELPKENLNQFSLLYLKSYLGLKDIIRLSLKRALHIKLFEDSKLSFSQHNNLVIDFDGSINYLLDGEKYNSISPLTINHYSKAISVISS